MASYTIEAAKESDDAALRNLTSVAMGGEIELSLRREPSFFHGVDVLGRSNSVLVARDKDNGAVVGVATRSLKPAFVDGRLTQLCYISGVRLHPDARNGLLLARGFREFRKLNEERPADITVTTIIEGNDTAMRLLTSGRAGLPRYVDWGEYVTLAICPGRRKKSRINGERAEIVRGSLERIDEIVRFLRRTGPAKQFYPAWSEDDFQSDSTFARGFDVTRLFVAEESGRIVGTLGIWDQGAFKQTYITGYRGRLRLVRPFYNAVAAVGGLAPLPRPGARLKTFFASHIAVEDDRPEVFRGLLRAAYNWVVEEGGYTYFVLGLHERDPLLAVAKEFRHMTYPARMYVVDWGGPHEIRSRLEERIPYLELATL